MPLWLSSLASDQQALIKQAWQLYEREVSLTSQQPSGFPDYGFVVFPLAKAYEGFLKDFLHTRGLITDETFRSRKFRLGRALNPDLHPDQHTEQWLYDDLARQCTPELARQVWETWLSCRNHVFHYFPNGNNSAGSLTLAEAKQRLDMTMSTIESLQACPT